MAVDKKQEVYMSRLHESAIRLRVPIASMVIVAILLIVSVDQSVSAAEPTPPKYTTSASCKACHVNEYARWSNSHHAWAWREATSKNVLGDFSDESLVHQNFTYRFLTKNGESFIIADDAKGSAVEYEVPYVIGVEPLQQYLVETERGRLQALDVAWNTEKRRWFHLYPNEDVSAGQGLHWSGSYKNFNGRCAECHATGYEKNYDPLTDTYNSQQTEIGVGCEACHGPGEAHVAWARKPVTFDRSQWTGIATNGLTDALGTGDAASEINACAGCHSRREPLGADSPPPGAAFDDHYRLALLRDGLYFPDGQIHDEVYVYGSFLQSKMYARGVRCTDCHDTHSYALRLRENAVCTQCHSPVGNVAFPTLNKSDYDSPAHHFHETGSDGAACISCHMLERRYMVVDGRRDHSFRVPRPDLAAKLNTPEPCTHCHQGKTTQWAAQEIAARVAHSRTGEAHFAESFAAANAALTDQTVRALTDIALDNDIAAIVRASAAQRLSPAPDAVPDDALPRLLSDESALVRGAAIGLQRFQSRSANTDVLLPLLGDPVRSVRIEAAKGFLGVSLDAVTKEDQPKLRAAMVELQDALKAKADYPEIQMMTGGVALTLRNLPAATHAFQRAVEMDPQLVDAWVMLARIQAAQGDRAAVRRTLKAAIEKNPGSSMLRQALQQLNE